MSVFVHAQGIKTVHAGGRGVKKRQNSVHVVVECPLSEGRSKIYSTQTESVELELFFWVYPGLALVLMLCPRPARYALCSSILVGSIDFYAI